MTTVNYINASFEVWGIVMSGVVALCMVLSKHPRKRIDRLYLACLICNVGVLLFDVLALLFRGNPGLLCWWGVRISNFLSFSFGSGLLISFSHYLTDFLGLRTRVSLRPLRIIRVVSICVFLLIVLTQFYPIVYFIDAQNMYHRADFFWLTQIAGVIGLLINILLLLRHRRCLQRREALTLWLYIILPTAAMCVQIFVYEIALLNLANTLCILVIFLFLQAEQGRLLARRETQLAQSRIAILLSQIQPHFLYNTLTAICGLCDENPKEAKKVTAKFSDYLRHNLDSLNQNDPIPFEHELSHTQIYLEIEQKRFGEKLSVLYDIQTSNFKLPSLTMQPIVENAVKHGATKKKGGGTVTISTRTQLDCYEIIIADDGVGFDTEKSKESSNTHIGIENVRIRLWAIIQGTLTITSEVGVGTVATIRIPKKEK